MSKRQNIEQVFKEAHLAASKQTEPAFSGGWESRLMDDVRRAAKMANPPVNDEVPLNLFAFRLGWAMLGLSIIVSAIFYATGIGTMASMERSSDSSLWELVDHSGDAYVVNFCEKNDGSEVK